MTVQPTLALFTRFSRAVRVRTLLPLRKRVDPSRERFHHWMVALTDLNARAIGVVPERKRIDVVPVDEARTFSAEKIGSLATIPRKAAPTARVVRSRMHLRSHTKRS